MNDAISRLGVSAWLANMGRSKLAEYILDEDRFPSVITSAEKTGKWIENNGFINCSVCGLGAPLYSYIKNGEKTEKVQHMKTDYCPNCGARMVGA